MGWAHVVLSYRQFVQNGTTCADYVVAVNEEVHEHQGLSGITDPDWATYWNNTPNADSWSIEQNTWETTLAKYIANVRAYGQFLSLQDMQARLQGNVGPYLLSLADPRQYTGPKKTFKGSKALAIHGPNAMAYASQTVPSTSSFDGSLSSDWDKITAYNWSFGDATTGSGRLVSHSYVLPGTYNVTLSVTSVAGTDSQTISVTAGATPGVTNTPTNTPTATAVPPSDPPVHLFLPFIAK